MEHRYYMALMGRRKNKLSKVKNNILLLLVIINLISLVMVGATMTEWSNPWIPGVIGMINLTYLIIFVVANI